MDGFRVLNGWKKMHAVALELPQPGLNYLQHVFVVENAHQVVRVGRGQAMHPNQPFEQDGATQEDGLFKIGKERTPGVRAKIMVPTETNSM